MTEMVERVAEALRTRCEGKRGDFKWADDGGMPQYREMSRAAIEAMREPTEAMANAVGSDWGFGLEGNWRAMIDAALGNK